MENSEIKISENDSFKYLFNQDKKRLIDYIFYINKTNSLDKVATVKSYQHFCSLGKNTNKEKEMYLKNTVQKNNTEDNILSKVDDNNNLELNNSKQPTINSLTKNNNIVLDSDKKDKELDFSITKHLAFKFMYFGHNYDGLITQNSTSNTIEEKIIQAFIKAKLIKDVESSKYVRCGRTDKGVSAFGNVFNLHVRYVKNYDYVRIINRMLPKDIKIIGVAEVDEDFSSRFSCKHREYKYFFLKKNLDIDLMKKAVAKLEGEHNFYNFCKVDKSKVDEDGNININFKRKIYQIEIIKYIDSFHISSQNKDFNQEEKEYYDVYYFKIKGSAFLWHMIRCIMSVTFAIGEKKEELELIDTLLNEENYHYNYAIASDAPLILSDCAFEGIEFKSSDDIKGTLSNFFCLSEIFEENLLTLAMKRYVINEFSVLVKNHVLNKDNSEINTIKFNDETENIANGFECNEYCIKNLKKEYPNMRNPIHYTPLLKRKRMNNNKNNA